MFRTQIRRAGLALASVAIVATSLTGTIAAAPIDNAAQSSDTRIVASAPHILAKADLAVKFISVSGNQLTVEKYVFLVTNLGPDTAQVNTDRWVIAYDGSGAQVVTSQPGSMVLASGATSTVTIVCQAPSPGGKCFGAKLAAQVTNGFDPDPSNNSAAYTH
jgi:hypothetical protein